jgi:hypothetical protein
MCIALGMNRGPSPGSTQEQIPRAVASVLIWTVTGMSTRCTVQLEGDRVGRTFLGTGRDLKAITRPPDKEISFEAGDTSQAEQTRTR